MPIRATLPARPILAAVVLLAVAGCTAAPGAPVPRSGEATNTETAASPTDPADTAFPLTLDNCGTEVTFDAPPQQIVAIKSSVTELALALGAADRIVGVAFLDGPFPPELAAAGAGLPEIAERIPAAEVVLETSPDLVFAGWESAFAPDAVGERAGLHAQGVATYVAPSACKDPDYMPNPLTVDHVFADITEAGAILGAPEEAERIVAEQRSLLEQVERTGDGLTALWFSSGSDTPYVGAGLGTPALMMDAVGLTNIAGDVADTWTPYSWEEVIDADPDVIVLVDSSWSSVDRKKEILAENPATAQLTAVVEERFVVLPFAATEAGVRTVPAILDLASQLAELAAG